MSNTTIVFGNTPFAQMVARELSTFGDRDVKAFTVDKDYLKEDRLGELPIIDFERLPDYYEPHSLEIIIGVGYNTVNKLRESIFEKVKNCGYRLGSFIHPSSIVAASAEIGEHCLIFEKNIIQPFARIEANTIIRSNNVISAHSIISGNCYLSASVYIGENAVIGKNCFLGIGSTVAAGVETGSHCIIGAQANLDTYLPKGSVIKGPRQVLHFDDYLV